MTADLVQDLRTLRLHGMADRLMDLLGQPKSNTLAPIQWVEALINAQSQRMGHQRCQRFLAQAGLPTHTVIADIQGNGITGPQWETLTRFDWVRHGHALLISGPSGSGKTCTLAALGREARMARWRVLYYRTPELLRDLALETDGRKRQKLFQRLARVPILMLDDFAAQKSNTQQCFELSHLMDARQRRGLGVVVASPCDPDEWDRFFEDPTAADALFSRLHAKAEYLTLKRKRQRTKR